MRVNKAGELNDEAKQFIMMKPYITIWVPLINGQKVYQSSSVCMKHIHNEDDGVKSTTITTT